MTAEEAIWLGADPGGRGAFGVAVLRGSSITSGVVSSVDCAVEFVRREAEFDLPLAAGIDAPLWWSSRVSGARRVDARLRKGYWLRGGQVQEPNSLRGAAVLQAAMLIVRLREWNPKIAITETHPKALLKGVFDEGFRGFAQSFEVGAEPATEHERDAVVGAVAAREAFSSTGRWRHDLSLDRYPEEQDPKSYWLAPVSYVWPMAVETL